MSLFLVALSLKKKAGICCIWMSRETYTYKSLRNKRQAEKNSDFTSLEPETQYEESSFCLFSVPTGRWFIVFAFQCCIGESIATSEGTLSASHLLEPGQGCPQVKHQSRRLSSEGGRAHQHAFGIFNVLRIQPLFSHHFSGRVSPFL